MIINKLKEMYESETNKLKDNVSASFLTGNSFKAEKNGVLAKGIGTKA